MIKLAGVVTEHGNLYFSYNAHSKSSGTEKALNYLNRMTGLVEFGQSLPLATSVLSLWGS